MYFPVVSMSPGVGSATEGKELNKAAFGSSKTFYSISSEEILCERMGRMSRANSILGGAFSLSIKQNSMLILIPKRCPKSVLTNKTKWVGISYFCLVRDILTVIQLSVLLCLL